MKTLLYCLSLIASFPLTPEVGSRQIVHSVEALPQIEAHSQVGHASELFQRAGYSYLLKNAQLDLRPFVLAAVEASLPGEFHEHAFEIARAAIIEGNRYNMDPFFLLAVMKTESQFNLDVVGTHGEIGLMQIMPSTAAWLAPQAGLSLTSLNLRDPATNIRLGATYFARLRRVFRHEPHRYVGAYNMGAQNVRRLLASNTEPRIYADKVLNNYSEFYRELSEAIAPAQITTNLALQSEKF